MTGSRPLAAAVAVLVVACSHGASAATAAFRVDDLDLRDPHFYTTFINCTDFTDSGFGFTFNGNLQNQIQGDADADGYLDLSYLIEFDPLDQSLSANAVTFGTTQCTAPLAGTSCLPVANGIVASAALSDSSACLEPLAGTTFGYSPPVASTTPACFSTAPAVVQLDVGAFTVPLHDTQIAATFDTVPAAHLANGLVRGFLTQADADNTIVPAAYPLIGGKPVSSLLPGGTDNCASHSDMDLEQGVAGWWVYFNFSASRVVIDPVFADDFEPEA